MLCEVRFIIYAIVQGPAFLAAGGKGKGLPIISHALCWCSTSFSLLGLAIFPTVGYIFMSAQAPAAGSLSL